MQDITFFFFGEEGNLRIYLETRRKVKGIRYSKVSGVCFIQQL